MCSKTLVLSPEFELRPSVCQNNWRLLRMNDSFMHETVHFLAIHLSVLYQLQRLVVSVFN